MAVVVAVLLVPVVLYCTFRAVVPRLGGAQPHARDIDVWHALLGAAMVWLFAAPDWRPLAWVTLALSAVGLVWGVVSVERRTDGIAHLRLVIVAAAMAVVVLPTAANASEPDDFSHLTGMAGMTGDHDAGITGVSGMTGEHATALLLALLLAGLALLAALRLPAAVRRSAGVVDRLDACCDVVMASVMAIMLLTLG